MDEVTLSRTGDDGLGFEIVAASLRADSADIHAFLTALASKLEGALPAQTRVERVRDGLFKSTTHIERISVDLGAMRYILQVKRGAPETVRAKSVGGVVIKTEPLPLDDWIDALARDLSVHAQSSSSARAALHRLVT